MPEPITRRDALLQTAALASAGVIPNLAFAAPSPKGARTGDIDKAFQVAVAAHEIPGVVAMAASGDSVL